MAPTESTLLHKYLLLPAPLPDIMTLQQFANLFPRTVRNSPQVRLLYRDLQHQRNSTIDAVAVNIEAEAKHSRAIRAEVTRARKEATSEELDEEVDIERALYGALPGETTHHDLQSIIPEMDSAVAGLEAEIQKLEEEEAALMDSLKQTVGSLSDLRYGKFANAQLRDGVVEGLKEFQDMCEAKS